MITRVLFNKKGGVGKSSLAVNLAAVSASRGFKTLVVDLDPQSNATQYLLPDHAHTDSGSIADYFEQSMRFHIRTLQLDEIAKPTQWDNLHILTGSNRLALLEAELQNRYKIYKLKELLKQAEGRFERIFIDTAPAFNFFSITSLIASDQCLVPVDCDEFAVRAVHDMRNHIEEVRNDHNSHLSIGGIIINQYQARANLPQQLVAALREDDINVFASHISSSVKMRESHRENKPLIWLQPNHKLAKEFELLFDEIEQITPS